MGLWGAEPRSGPCRAGGQVGGEAAGLCLGYCHLGRRELGLVEPKVEATHGPQVAAASG